ncbi:CAF1 family ribonuclease [Trichophyton equinum CBS 127.97]|uniref:CAF1 family ribonuclease n=1 Tax=Trichophyton equinum (strain ATCC MYA-4606 / CBS 127.97) TaxID=559882 RepID=F2PQX5_TRIEC|nr:CAF1 family ribonuclease [Trichophyton equinum CBS 127.97]
MEVTRNNFSRLLPRMLQDIGDCSFVALDFEFSGIFNQKLRPASAYVDGDLSLQKRYEEVKQAAEEYQILQVGLTLVVEDDQNDTYSLRPYNIPLSPILDPRLGVERKWSFQSSALAFLKSHGFRVESIFTDGVPYISMKEEQDAMDRAHTDKDKLSRSLINFDTLAPDHAQFIQQVRHSIREWIEKPAPKDTYLNIPKPAGMTAAYKLPLELDNYQKRLVHQIVQSEYPGYVSIGKKSFIQILPYDKMRENVFLQKKLQRTRCNIASQKGFSWVIEALMGSELSKLDLRLLWRPDGMFTAAEGSKLTKECEALREKLRSGPPVLVGHNLFTDLVNFYKCFIGDLPSRVEDFQQAINELFPLVIDTKYMATTGGVLRDASSALSTLMENLGSRAVPKSGILSHFYASVSTFSSETNIGANDIETHPDHSSYNVSTPMHEAGYDSLMTAQIFLKLAVQLYETSSPREALVNRANGDATEIDLMDLSTEPDDEQGKTENTTQQKLVYGHATKFDLLLDMDNEESGASSVGPSEQDSLLEQKVIEGKLLPRLDDDFWSKYINKLRVFGTTEEVCDLSVHPSSLDLEAIN